MSTRFDCFLIWGHGLEHRDEIVGMIRARREFEIVRLEHHRPRDMAKFVREVYRYDSVPFEHLRKKTAYLLTTSPEVFGVFVRNNNPNEAPFGEGAFRRRACMNVKQVKEQIRDRFNPRLTEGNSRRSEDHVIHGSDHPKQVDHLLRVMGHREGMEAIAREPSRVISAPPHMPQMNRYTVRPVAAESVYANVLTGDTRVEKTLVPLAETPHFRFLAGDREAYAKYWARHRGSSLCNDHSPEAFDRLANEFQYLSKPNSGRYIVLRAETTRDGKTRYVIMDGLHRAAILQHQGHSRWIAAVIN